MFFFILLNFSSEPELDNPSNVKHALLSRLQCKIPRPCILTRSGVPTFCINASICDSFRRLHCITIRARFSCVLKSNALQEVTSAPIRSLPPCVFCVSFGASRVIFIVSSKFIANAPVYSTATDGAHAEPQRFIHRGKSRLIPNMIQTEGEEALLQERQSSENPFVIQANNSRYVVWRDTICMSSHCITLTIITRMQVENIH